MALHGLDRTRYNVTVCATRSAGNYQPILDRGGVRTVVLGRRNRWEMYKLLRLVRLLRRTPVQVLHTHLFGSNTWGRVLGKLAGVPVIVAHEHWSTKSSREARIDHLLAPLSDRILVPSEESKQLVVETDRISPRLVSVIYNGVDVEQFAPASLADREQPQPGAWPTIPFDGRRHRGTPERRKGRSGRADTGGERHTAHGARSATAGGG